MRGFSLVETALAMSLVALILILVVTLFPDTLLALRRSEQSIQADQWAQTLMETQMGQPFNQLIPGTMYAPPDRTIGSTAYHAQSMVFTVNGTRQDLLKGINVTITWEHGGKNFENDYQCLVSHVGR